MYVAYKDVEEDFKRYQAKIDELERKIAQLEFNTEKDIERIRELSWADAILKAVTTERNDLIVLLKECGEVLKENNFRGDLQDRISEYQVPEESVEGIDIKDKLAHKEG